jgi:hypothetical protein
MNLYETIFTRRSVRQYENAPLSEAELADIQSALEAAPEIPGQSARFEIVEADEIPPSEIRRIRRMFKPAQTAPVVFLSHPFSGIDGFTVDMQSVSNGPSHSPARIDRTFEGLKTILVGVVGCQSAVWCRNVRRGDPIDDGLLGVGSRPNHFTNAASVEIAGPDRVPFIRDSESSIVNRYCNPVCE